MKALIIEDETAAALNLEAILKQVAPGVEVIGTLESVEESIGWLRANPQPDLLFMDIHLADGDSFRIFDAVEIAAPVIFTTAYDQYALEAFKVNSIDYLLKPLNASDVGRALAKLHRLTSVERSDYGSRVRTLAASRREEVFLVHVRDKIIPLHRSRIAYCYTSNEKVTAYGFDGAAYPLDKTLEALQGLLPESEFFRANRQFIVARQAVKEIAVWFGSRLTLHLTVETPERIVISKARVPEFKAWLRSAVLPGAWLRVFVLALPLHQELRETGLPENKKSDAQPNSKNYEKEDFCSCRSPLPDGGNGRFRTGGQAGRRSQGASDRGTDGAAHDRTHAEGAEAHRCAGQGGLQPEFPADQGDAGHAREDAGGAQGRGRKNEVDPDDRTVRAVGADAGAAARPARAWSPDDEKRRPSRRRQGVL